MPTVEWGRAHLNARRTRHRHGGRPLAAVRGRGLRKVVERHSVGVDAVRRKELAAVRLGNGGEQRVRALLSRQNVDGLIIKMQRVNQDQQRCMRARTASPAGGDASVASSSLASSVATCSAVTVTAGASASGAAVGGSGDASIAGARCWAASARARCAAATADDFSAAAAAAAASTLAWISSAWARTEQTTWNEGKDSMQTHPSARQY